MAAQQKRVQFSQHIDFISTFANEEYDRTAQKVAKLTYNDMVELLTLRSQWRRQMEEMLANRANAEKSQNDNNSDSSVLSSSNHCEILA